jgi:hypothetical protein
VRFVLFIFRLKVMLDANTVQGIRRPGIQVSTGVGNTTKQSVRHALYPANLAGEKAKNRSGKQNFQHEVGEHTRDKAIPELV